MRIIFLRDEIYETEGPKKGPRFFANSVWDCTQEFAERWTRRGAAEQVGAQEPKGGVRYSYVKGPKASGDPAEAPAAPEPTPPLDPAQ